ncbi:MAG: pyridoxamine 5'-phosphate oxidase family protein [Rhizobiaceae bacterium]|nr:pyridoxamine 5'-phosphate oxidase family protein [Rhizobiaceae bacterium]
MTKYSIKTEFLIENEVDLRALFPPTHELAIKKEQNKIDKHAQDFIARAPFVCVGTHNDKGLSDVSPRGDAPGFVQILDETTIAIPDRPGNNRLDTLSNITHNQNIGLMFFIPGFDETLRINGEAQLTTDPKLLATMAVKGQVPKIAILVHIKELYMHCAKAFRRSKLWDPASLQDRNNMPSLMKIMLDQADEAPDDQQEMEKLDAALEDAYQKSMY